MTATRGYVRCALAAVLFGVSVPFASRLTDDVGPFTLAGLLYTGAALATAPVLGRHRPSAAAVRRAAPGLAIAVVLGGAVGPVLLMMGLRDVDAASASLLTNLELVFTTIVAVLVFGEHVGRRVVIGTVLVVGASAVLGWSGDPDLRWGAVLIAAACLCWAVDNGATAAIDQLAPAHITFVKGIVAGGANLTIGVLGDGWPPMGTVLAALVVGAFGYGLSITLWVSGARDLGAARGQLVFASAPFIGAVVAWVVLGESTSGRELVAVALAATGVLFVLERGHEHAHRHQPTHHDHEHTHDDGHHDHRHPDGFTGRHQHPHDHAAIVHRHPHLPDLHHRHDHAA